MRRGVGWPHLSSACLSPQRRTSVLPQTASATIALTFLVARSSGAPQPLLSPVFSLPALRDTCLLGSLCCPGACTTSQAADVHRHRSGATAHHPCHSRALGCTGLRHGFRLPALEVHEETQARTHLPCTQPLQGRAYGGLPRSRLPGRSQFVHKRLRHQLHCFGLFTRLKEGMRWSGRALRTHLQSPRLQATPLASCPSGAAPTVNQFATCHFLTTCRTCGCTPSAQLTLAFSQLCKEFCRLRLWDLHIIQECRMAIVCGCRPRCQCHNDTAERCLQVHEQHSSHLRPDRQRQGRLDQACGAVEPFVTAPCRTVSAARWNPGTSASRTTLASAFGAAGIQSTPLTVPHHMGLLCFLYAGASFPFHAAGELPVLTTAQHNAFHWPGEAPQAVRQVPSPWGSVSLPMRLTRGRVHC